MVLQWQGQMESMVHHNSASDTADYANSFSIATEQGWEKNLYGVGRGIYYLTCGGDLTPLGHGLACAGSWVSNF